MSDEELETLKLLEPEWVEEEYLKSKKLDELYDSF